MYPYFVSGAVGLHFVVFARFVFSEILDNIIRNNDQQAYPWPQLRGYLKNSDLYEDSLHHLRAGLISDWKKSWQTASQFMAGIDISLLFIYFFF